MLAVLSSGCEVENYNQYLLAMKTVMASLAEKSRSSKKLSLIQPKFVLKERYQGLQNAVYSFFIARTFVDFTCMLFFRILQVPSFLFKKETK